MIVRVYRNLHTKTLSMQTKCRNGWRVTAHPKRVELRGVTFTVSKAGLARCRRDRRKNVHAWIEGWLIAEACTNVDLLYQAHYNPALVDTFIGDDGKPLHKASRCIVDSLGVVTYWPTPA